jgi:hypothetical protein
MFLEVNGPTALRPEMVRALAFSTDEARVETLDGRERCVAAVAAVWNGRRGYVAVLLRFLDKPLVRRFTFSEAIRALEEMSIPLEEGMGFAASLGFVMDGMEFMSLDPAQKQARLKRWNQLRKPLPSPMYERRAQGAAPNEPAGSTPDAGPQATAASATPSAGEGARPAVLGRISLVRQGGAEGRPDLLTQLLAFF